MKLIRYPPSIYTKVSKFSLMQYLDISNKKTEMPEDQCSHNMSFFYSVYNLSYLLTLYYQNIDKNVSSQWGCLALPPAVIDLTVH